MRAACEIEVAGERMPPRVSLSAALRSGKSERVKRVRRRRWPRLPSHARVVVIGGGAVGCSALYHLTKLGWTDAVLLERDELTSGSTWHAAGNCPNFSTAWNLIKLQRYTTQLYARLGARGRLPINYHVTGASAWRTGASGSTSSAT